MEPTMKHHFILNPKSGRRKKLDSLIAEIKDAEMLTGTECEIYLTRSRGDASRYARELCAKADEKGERLRIYGCGGDGTLNELVNGCYGFDNVEIGIIPQGTGNDYIRNYGSEKYFLDVKRQIHGDSVWSDLIHYRASCSGKVTEGYCANMFNIGFDANVVDMTDRIKKVPLVAGSLAYLISVAIMLFTKKGADLVIEYPDGSKRSGKVLLTAAANGCYCGGGVKGLPRSILDDGLMDVSVVNGATTRSQFVRLFPFYQKGTHLEHPLNLKKKIVDYRQVKSLKISATSDPDLPDSSAGAHFKLCTDGEISLQDQVEFSVVKKAFRFIVPKGL